jgi:hypothetical protein
MCLNQRAETCLTQMLFQTFKSRPEIFLKSVGIEVGFCSALFCHLISSAGAVVINMFDVGASDKMYKTWLNCRRPFMVDPWSTVYRKLVDMRMDKTFRGGSLVYCVQEIG